MKIACVTPFYALSSVGDVAARTAAAMRRAGHDVLLIGTGRAPYWQTDLEFLGLGEFGRMDPRALDEFDAVVYHAVNDPAAAPAFWLAERVPGIVVLHDRTYVHGYEGYTRNFLGRPRYFETLAERYYGAEGAEFVRRFRAGQAGADEVFRFGLVPSVLENALGAIVHFREFAESVRSLTGIPVVDSHRPAYPRRDPEGEAAPRAESAGGDRLLLAYVGHVSPYRCLHLLFETLRDRPDLRARISVAILGKVDDDAFLAELKRTAHECGLEGAIRWQINATEDEKHALLAGAGAAFNCRSLNSEGLSGSLMEEMTYGLPAIVNRGGFAREVPDDCVYFVPNDDVRAGIERSLDALVGDPEERRQVGRRAAAWAAANGSTAEYAAAIVDLAQRTMECRAAKSVAGMLRAAFDAMDDLPGNPLERALLARIGVA